MTMRPISLRCLFILFSLLTVSPVFSQEADNFGVFAPYVSELRVSLRDPEVRLTWKDIENFETRYGVYRHTREITSANFSQAEKIGTVESGIMYYIDVPPQIGAYFYAVLALDDAGNPYRLFIPLRNLTLVAANITNPPPPPPVEEIPPVPLAASIQGLRVEPRADGQALEITFQVDSESRRISVYRSTSPLVDSDSISSAILVDTLGSTTGRVIDFVIPGISYYYAVIDADTLATGPEDLVPGFTTLEKPVSLPLGSQVIARSETPTSNARMPGLPLLNPRTSFVTGQSLESSFQGQIPQAQPPSPRSTEAFDILSNLYPPSQEHSLSRTILPVDSESNDTQGEARVLQAILRTEFSNENWAEAIVLFENLLTLPLEQELRSRTEFYLGQSRYFSGNLEQAYLTFLIIRNDLPQDVRPWLNRILDDLTAR